jgi:hypothetical protein
MLNEKIMRYYNNVRGVIADAVAKITKNDWKELSKLFASSSTYSTYDSDRLIQQIVYFCKIYLYDLTSGAVPEFNDFELNFMVRMFILEHLD